MAEVTNVKLVFDCAPDQMPKTVFLRSADGSRVGQRLGKFGMHNGLPCVELLVVIPERIKAV